MSWRVENTKEVEAQGWTMMPPVDAALIGKALDMIDADLERDPPKGDAGWDACSKESFCPSIREQFAFLLTETGLLRAVQAGVGPCRHDPAQIARRRHGDEGGPHLDGFYEDSKYPDAEADTPDAVLGIYLTEVVRKEDGAFSVWPGERATVKRWADGLAGVPKRTEGTWPNPEMDKGVPLIGPAGMSFLVHGAVLHCNALRETERGYRDAVFFRLYRRERDVLALLRSGGREWPR